MKGAGCERQKGGRGPKRGHGDEKLELEGGAIRCRTQRALQILLLSGMEAIESFKQVPSLRLLSGWRAAWRRKLLGLQERVRGEGK